MEPEEEVVMAEERDEHHGMTDRQIGQKDRGGDCNSQ